MRIVIEMIPDEGIEVDKMDEESSCPVATQDSDVNEMNKLDAVEEADYRDPGMATDICGNCGAYNQTEDMMECIGADDDAGLGYCQIFKFVCESAYTCDKWVQGGPITSVMKPDHYRDVL